MANEYISEVQLPGDSNYKKVKDSEARSLIETNRSNIWYATNKVGKNELKLTGDVSNPNTLKVYWNYDEGTVRITGTSATTSTVFILLGSWTAKKTGEYVLASEGANSSDIYVYDDGSWNTNGSPTATWTAGTTRSLYVRIKSGVVVGDVTVKPMVCLKSLYDADSSVDVYALPNYDLTRLESEDRAALAEDIDSGAKNKWNFANAGTQTVYSSTITKTDTDVTVTSTGTYGNVSYGFSLPAGNYVFSCKISDINASGSASYQPRIILANNTSGTNAAGVINFTTNGTKSVEFTWTGGTIYVQYQPNASGNSFKASENMICTKAAFGVSNKFVPYRLLYSDISTKVQLSNQRLGNNATTFAFDISDYQSTSSNRYRYGLLIGGVDATHVGLYHVFIDASNNVTLTAVVAYGTRTLTASISGSTLTITADNTLYGGLRLVWLD